MEDQLANLPPQLPGASLSGSHGGLREVAGTIRDLRAGRVKVIFCLYFFVLSVFYVYDFLQDRVFFVFVFVVIFSHQAFFS